MRIIMEAEAEAESVRVSSHIFLSHLDCSLQIYWLATWLIGIVIVL